MSKSTYYIVQTACDMFIMRTNDGRYVSTYAKDEATKFTFGEAQKVFKDECERARRLVEAGYHAPRRFPRIVKVTIETKTIKDRR